MAILVWKPAGFVSPLGRSSRPYPKPACDQVVAGFFVRAHSPKLPATTYTHRTDNRRPIKGNHHPNACRLRAHDRAHISRHRAPGTVSLENGSLYESV